jgi:hypothetical protein
MILWVVHALHGVDGAEEDVVEPLHRHRRHLPRLGLRVLDALRAGRENKVSKFLWKTETAGFKPRPRGQTLASRGVVGSFWG